jgi:DNA-binding NarL/FixJ family response regulator
LPNTLGELMARRKSPKGRTAGTRAPEQHSGELAALREQLRKVTAERDAALSKLDKRQVVRETPSDRREAVLALLRKGGQTDRAIARVVGVSPQTVGNLRRSLSA